MLADPNFLATFAATWRYQLGLPRAVTLAPDGNVLFLRSEARSFEHALWEQRPDGEERRLLSVADLIGSADAVLSAEERARLERLRSATRGLISFGLDRAGRHVLLPVAGRLFLYDRRTERVVELPRPAGRGLGGAPLDARFSPDGRSIACVADGELHTLALGDKAWVRLTFSASDEIVNGLPEFVAEEEMHRYAGYWWSPDSQSIAFEEVDHRGVERLYIADARFPERAPAVNPYPRAGGTNVKVRLGVVPASGGAVVFVPWDRDQLPYLAQVAWAGPDRLSLVVQDRAQQDQRLLRVDGASGLSAGALDVREILREQDAAWINLFPSMPWWLGGTGADRGFLWISERDGAPCLEHHDADGGLVRRLTAPELGLFQVLGLDGPDVVVLAGPEPGERVLMAVPLEGGAPRRLVGPPGVYSVVLGGGRRVETASTRAGTAVTLVQGELRRPIRSLAERAPVLPDLEHTRLTVPADETGPEREIHAMILRPRDFEAGRRYPVLVYVYGGPHVQVVQEHAAGFYLQQWYADHGFIVVAMDGRGTPGRGRDWERAIRGDVISAPLADQVAGLRRLGQLYPEMDLGRVGIQGWSFGGYFAAMAVMRRPDVFHAAVAGAPVVDWADYDTHYTERYLGLPSENTRGYQDNNVLHWASGLSRPLLLVHGTADDNVYFTHALKLADALFRAGKPFSFLPLAGYTHMVPDPEVTVRLYSRVIGFLRESLS